MGNCLGVPKQKPWKKAKMNSSGLCKHSTVQNWLYSPELPQQGQFIMLEDLYNGWVQARQYIRNPWLSPGHGIAKVLPTLRCISPLNGIAECNRTHTLKSLQDRRRTTIFALSNALAIALLILQEFNLDGATAGIQQSATEDACNCRCASK